MTDFRKLALEFVLEDDEAKLANIARRTASEIEAASADTNPVARWVQAVQPWMPGSNDQGPMEVDSETPNWTARARALDFLSRTLAFLNQDTLKPSQVKLLIAFFGSMFEVDHKAGIMASATALSHIITFKSFQPQSGRDIIRKVCALSEDFARQVPKTRLAIYELLRSLIADATVASHLQRNDGPASSFMVDLLRLFQKERDPECLMVWFNLMSFFLAGFSPSEEVLEAVFGAFKAYFPITLPRTSQSSLTPDTLKIQLRKCFSSCHRLAHLTLPFLLSKLDQGDGVTVGVKIDILRTIRACIEEYSHPDQSVAPHASNLWASLKYEVRNGEVEDTIWATLEALKAVTMRLPPGALREFALTVARECVSDLSDQTYTAAAGRLLISVLSANIHAFVLMVSPIVTHIKENLRHAKSPVHSQDLLKILRIILETRLLFADAQMTDPEMGDFATTDSIFISLYEDVFRSAIQLQNKADASFDDIKISTEAAQGTGALVSQRLVKPLNPEIEQQQLNRELLLPENTWVEVCDALFAIVARSWDIRSRKADYDELINESIVALRRTVEVYPPRFNILMNQGLTTIRKSYTLNTEESSTVVQRVSSVMAFVGCSNLRPSCESGMRAYFSLTCALTSELLMAMDMRKGTDIWCALVAGIQSAFRYFGDAFQGMSSDATTREQQSLHCEEPVQNTWLSKITKKYPILHSIEPTSNAPDGQSIVVPKLCNISDLREDFLLASLFLCRQLYRRVTKPLEDNSVHGKKALCLSEDFNGSDPKAESRFLATLSNLASFIVGEFNQHGSSSLQFDEIFLTLFRDDIISVPSSTGRGANIAAAVNSWSWLAFGPLNVLSLGILKSLLPSSVMRLFTTGVAQEILLSGVSLSFPLESNPIARAILAILANRYEVETLGDLMSAIERALDTTIQQVTTRPSQDDERQCLEKASTLFTLLGGLLRRCTSSRTKALRRALLQAPDGPSANYFLAKGLELIVAPQPFVTDSIGSVQKPLWMQKLYVDLVRPMMDAANGISSQTRSPLIRTNYGIAVLVMVRHMKFPIYEDDAGDIVRICIATSQNLGVGSDTQAALGVIKNIIIDAPSALHDHLQSLINICTSVIARTPTSALQRPAWMPQDYAAVAGDDGQAAAACTSLALEVLGCLLRLFDTSLLLPCAPRVRRELAAACGLDVRDLRSVARYARAAWADLR